MNLELTLEDLATRIVLDALEFVALQLPVEIARRQLRREIAVANAIDLDLELRRIDADERNALLPARRQHIALAREVHGGLPIRHIDRERDVLLDRFVHIRRQAGAQLHFVALTMRHAFDAELTALNRHRLRILAVDGDELRKVHLPA